MTDVAKLQMLNAFGPTLIGGPTNFTFDGTADALAFVFQAPTTSPITALGVRYGAKVGTGTPTFLAALESVNAANGQPTGTILGGGSPASVTFTPPSGTSWDGTWQKFTFTNSYTPAALGEMIAATIRYSSGTLDASNGSSITRGLANSVTTSAAMPYHLTNASGSWTKSSLAYTFAIYTASNVYFTPATGASVTATADTSGHKCGMFLTLPSGMGTTFVPRGLHFLGKLGATSGSYKIGVWNSSGTQINITGTLDSDITGSVGASAGCRIIFDSPPTLNFGTKYYFAIECQGTGTVGISGIQLGSAGDRAAYPLGESRGLVTFNGTTWTEDSTVMPYMDLILDDITVPSGGGNMIICGE